MVMERIILYSLVGILTLSLVTLFIYYNVKKPIPPENTTLSIKCKDHSVQAELIRESPRIILYHNFLTPEECKHLINVAEGRFKRSTVQDKSNVVSKSRTSHSCFLKKSEDPVIKKVEDRAALLSELPKSNMEPLQVVRYHPGEYYNAHYDFFVPGKTGTDIALRNGGQRRVTFFVYLNDLPSEDTGGCTYFDKIDLRVKPKMGTAVFWLDCTPDGKEDFLTHHAGEPPKVGVKYGLNIWIREKPFN